MKLPKQNYQDAIISLGVCLSQDLVKTLFPPACERILSLASLYSEECAGENDPLVPTPGHQDLSSNYTSTSKVIQQDYIHMLTCEK
jgi:hypothetical protein